MGRGAAGGRGMTWMPLVSRIAAGYGVSEGVEEGGDERTCAAVVEDELDLRGEERERGRLRGMGRTHFGLRSDVLERRDLSDGSHRTHSS